MKFASALAFVVLPVFTEALAGPGGPPHLAPRSFAVGSPVLLELSSNETVKLIDPEWTSTGPDSTDYNEETYVSWLPMSIETALAGVYLLLLSSAPLVLAGLTRREEPLTKTHMLESLALVAWLWSCVFLFTNILKFQSAHWTGTRPLTPVEAVYLLSQILTTVGYGDITPAFPRGQVWVGINVIIALCLYGSIVMEVVGMAVNRVHESVAQRGRILPTGEEKIRDWSQHRTVDKSTFTHSAIFFGSAATVGVLFWHLFPGEGKTWLQAVYMSIITLSTVGFGAFNAVTEGGKVFGAYWMLIGVAALGALIGSFIELMVQAKAVEKHKDADDHAQFTKCLDACLDDKGELDEARFLKFSLMLAKGVDQKALEKIEARYEFLSSEERGTKAVRRTVVVDRDGPPL